MKCLVQKDLADLLVSSNMFDMFPDWFQIFFGSMIPWIEARYVIPYAMLELQWTW